MRISDFIAQTITQRRALVWSGVALLTIGCIAILVTSLRLDSEVFNVLPGRFSSVQGLKIYDRDFEQTRELTFALLCDPNDVDKLEESAPVFAERLRQQPWCARVLAGSPMGTPEGIRDLQSIAVPLLLNLEPRMFDETMLFLQPEKIRDRLHRLRQQIEAGSPRPQFELSFDPLGLIAPALKPFAESTIIEQEQPLTSPDRTMRIFLVVTNQTSVSAFECQRLMRRVNEFRVIAGEGWSGVPLQIFITGRPAFVSEISLSMRYDVVATLLGSILLVGAIFFAGFPRMLSTQHGQRRLLCHSRRAGCRFRNSHARAVPPGACRRRTTSESYCHFRRKTWSSGVLWRAHDCSWIPRAGAEWRHEFFATWCAHCDWHFRRRPVHVLDFVPVCSRPTVGNSL